MRRIHVMLMIGAMAGLLAVASAGALAQEATEVGSQRSDDLEITLLSAPPLSPSEMERMMRGMGGMQGPSGMQGMKGMKGGMPSMGGMGGGEGQATHYIGVIVRDVKADRVVHGLDLTLTAQNGGVTRTVKLMPMPGSYGANVSLPRKGTYVVTVTIARPGQPAAAAFEFVYK